MSRSPEERHVARSPPRVGEIVHILERVEGHVDGPMPAIVVAVDCATVTAWVFSELGLHLAPAVPYDDDGAEAGVWWCWPA